MLSTSGLQLRLMLVGQFDEDVFQAWSEWTNFSDGNAVFQELVAEVVEIEMIVDEGMNGLPENGSAANAGDLAGETKRAGDFRRGDFDPQGALRLNVRKFAERIWGAVGDELAEINVGDVAAALGFIHVVSGYEKRDAMTGKLEEKVPKLTARDGVDAGGGLIEEKQFRLVQHGAAESEALLPATGKLRCQAIQIGREAVELDDFVDTALQARGFQAVDTSVELQVFRDGQVVVEAEILRHIADALADGFRIRGDIETFDKSRTAAERQEAGKHFDDGGFSAAVGAEESEDFAFFDAEADVVDGGEVAESSDEILRGDGGVREGFRVSWHSFSFPLLASHRQTCRQARARRDQ